MSDDFSICLFIDGENLHLYYKELIDRLKELGKIVIARAYADFTSQNVKDSRKKEFIDLGITPIQHFSYSNGKNSTDSKMIVDAMDILYKNKINALCIATNDSDFTTLAVRFREENIFVIGASLHDKVPGAFKSVCDKFIILGETKLEEKDNNEVKPINVSQITETVKTKSDVVDKKTIIKACKDIITKNRETEDEYIDFSFCINELTKKYNEFDPRLFGHQSSKASSFFSKLKEFEMKSENSVLFIKIAK